MTQRPKTLTELFEEARHKLLTPPPINLDWAKCEPAVWCELERLDLSKLGDVFGVYVIWHGGENSKWVRVGQGKIGERLAAHRADPQILVYRQFTLYVSWAPAAPDAADGIEAFLARQCNPLIGDRFPDVTPIPVNVPA